MSLMHSSSLRFVFIEKYFKPFLEFYKSSIENPLSSLLFSYMGLNCKFSPIGHMNTTREIKVALNTVPQDSIQLTKCQFFMYMA